MTADECQGCQAVPSDSTTHETNAKARGGVPSAWGIVPLPQIRCGALGAMRRFGAVGGTSNAAGAGELAWRKQQKQWPSQHQHNRVRNHQLTPQPDTSKHSDGNCELRGMVHNEAPHWFRLVNSAAHSDATDEATQWAPSSGYVSLPMHQPDHQCRHANTHEHHTVTASAAAQAPLTAVLQLAARPTVLRLVAP